MNKFYEITLPPNISCLFSGGPEYNTQINETKNGTEYRTINWDSPRCSYTISYNDLDQNQLGTLLSFFYLCKGKAFGFRFKDWFDYKINNQLIGIGDGLKREFQIYKEYRVHELCYLRKITKIVKSSETILINKKVLDRDRYSINNDGLIILQDMPANQSIIEVCLDFDIPVRFDIDNLNAYADGRNSYKWPNITLIEIK